MQFLLKNQSQYGAAILKLSALTVLFVVGCMLFGYLLLPPAAAFYAGILVYEKKTKRIMSYAIPAVMFTINFLLRGFYSLEAVAYIFVGVIIYLASTRKLSKGEAVFWVTLAVTVLMLISAVLISFESAGGVGIIPIKQFYSNLYRNFRDAFIDKVSSLTVTLESGTKLFAYNSYEAEAMLFELVILFLPSFLVACFAVAGLTFKCFSRLVDKLSGEESGIYEWSFKTSNTVAYFYILISVLDIFIPSSTGVFAFSLMTLNTFFSVVFAYLGIKNLYAFFINHGRSSLFSKIAIAVVFVLLSSNAVSIFSYIGAIVNIASNNAEKALKNN